MSPRRVLSVVFTLITIAMCACSSKEDLKPLSTEGFPLAKKKGLAGGGGGSGGCDATNCGGCCDLTATPVGCAPGFEDSRCGINGNPCIACPNAFTCNSTTGQCG